MVTDDALGSARILSAVTLSPEHPQARTGPQRQQVTTEATVLPALKDLTAQPRKATERKAREQKHGEQKGAVTQWARELASHK